jgi:hypothetical protein
MGKRLENCWELMHCGREPSGDMSAQQGVCPVFDAVEYNGVNDGQNGGRFCWTVAGTLCHGHVQGTFAEKFMNCMSCEFYEQVVREHGVNAVIINPEQLS